MSREWTYVNSKSIIVDGKTLNFKKEHTIEDIATYWYSRSSVELSNGSMYSFVGGGGTSGSGSDIALLKYTFEKDNLYTGTELTQTRPSVPQVANNKGFLTSPDPKSLLSFYEAFAYNPTNYQLILDSGDNVEVSFLCSDRRYGTAGSRRAWSPYFKIRDLISQRFIDIQNVLVGTDASPEYFIKAKIEVNPNANLFITVIDGHSGVNLYGAILNIRHRIVN